MHKFLSKDKKPAPKRQLSALTKRLRLWYWCLPSGRTVHLFPHRHVSSLAACTCRTI